MPNATLRWRAAGGVRSVTRPTYRTPSLLYLSRGSFGAVYHVKRRPTPLLRRSPQERPQLLRGDVAALVILRHVALLPQHDCHEPLRVAGAEATLRDLVFHEAGTPPIIGGEVWRHVVPTKPTTLVREFPPIGEGRPPHRL